MRFPFMFAFPLLLAGCLGGQDYVRPAPPVAAVWPAPGDVPDALDAAHIDWQDFFTDPRLQAMVRLALEHNRDLRIAAGRLEAARAEFGIARTEALPKINASLGQSNAGQSAEVAGQGNERITHRTDFSLGVVSFELDLWDRLGSLSEAARASFLATEAARRSLRLSLIGEIAGTYFNLIELEERLSLARSALGSHKQTVGLVALANQEGFASNLEKLTAEGALNGTRAQIALLERQAALARNKLALLVGTMPADLPPPLPLSRQELHSDLAAGIPAETLLARPDVIEAELRLRAAHANIHAARAAFLPKILLTASLGLASRSLTSLLGAGQAAWNFQPTLTQPIFDWGRNQGNLDLAEARKNVAVAEYEKKLQEAFREVADLLAMRRTLHDQRQTAEQQLAINAERVKIMEARREAGVASRLNVLEAERELLATEQAHKEIRRMELANTATLYKALGGGEQALAATARPDLLSAK